MQIYLDLMKKILEEGVDRGDRTGTGTRSIFGTQMRFDLSQGFPLLTTKKVHLKSIIYELLWFLKGDTNIKYLHDHKVSIWDEWADENGDLGPVYGKQWRRWECADGRVIDQISNAIHDIKTNPNSRRIIVNAWNVGEVENMALPPCHLLFQFYVANGKLSCLLYQRSCDTHLYHNHFEQAREQLSRTPRPLPQMLIKRKAPTLFDYDFDDFELVGYDPYPVIKAPVAV